MAEQFNTEMGDFTAKELSRTLRDILANNKVSASSRVYMFSDSEGNNIYSLHAVEAWTPEECKEMDVPVGSVFLLPGDSL